MTRVLVLAKRSSLRLAKERHDERISRLLHENDPAVRRMRASHEAHESTIQEVVHALDALGVRTDFFYGSRTVIHGDKYSLVVTVGGDGTLLAASHRLAAATPILGINSAPQSSVGFFCAGRKGSAEETLRKALAGELRPVTLTRMQVELNGTCLHRRVLNEALICHACPAATSRYILEVSNGKTSKVEEQRSSGLWIGPAAGSTAAQASAGGRVLPLSSRRVQYVVREPYQYGASLRLRAGTFGEAGFVRIRSKMEDARLFLDGHHIAYSVQIGDVLVMKRSPQALTVLGLVRPRTK